MEEEEIESEMEDIVEVVEEEEPSSTDVPPAQDEDDLPAVAAQSVCNKLKWFFIRNTFKVFFQCVKVLMVVAIAVICFEAFMQGSVADLEKVMAAGKEDLLGLANFTMVKVKQLAVVIMEKKEE